MFESLATPLYGNNTLQDYAMGAGIFVGTIVLLEVIKGIVLARFAAFSKRSETPWDNAVISALDSIGWPLYIAVGLYAGSMFITVDEAINTIINDAILIIVVIYVILAIQQFLESALSILIHRYGAKGDNDIPLDSTIGNFLKNAIRAALWVGGVVVVLQNLGFQITALLGGLGIAGIAIAFAFQNILSDIFAFFTIYFDKPFKEGDFIVLSGGDLGTIQHIGIKSTRIKTLQGHELTISNQELTSTRINNFKRMETRRIATMIGVTYETPTKKLKKIPGMIEKIIKAEKNVEFGRAHFKEYGDFSLNFEIVYTIQSSEYEVYMDIRQAINLAIKEAFEKEGIEFAYPTQKILLSQES